MIKLLGDLFNDIFFFPIVNLLLVILHFFQNLHLPGALGLSIIGLSLLIRIIVWPIMARQLRLSRKMAELRPHMAKLKEKHGSDRQALALAQSQLYKEHGVNPAAGCLPALIQLPVFIALFHAIPLLLNPKLSLSDLNNYLYPFLSWAHLAARPDPYFLGLNLVSRPEDLITHLGINAWYVMLVPLVTGLLQFVQSSMAMSNAPAPVPTTKPKGKTEKKEESFEDTAAAMQSQMKYIIPVALAYSAFIFQIGLAIYYNISTLLGIIQQYSVSGWKGFPGYTEKVETAKKK